MSIFIGQLACGGQAGPGVRLVPWLEPGIVALYSAALYSAALLAGGCWQLVYRDA
jgi:hypothetical protein